jgi:osmotically-inducible protein OsmY
MQTMTRLLIVLTLALGGIGASAANADSQFDGRLRDVIQDRFFNDSRVLSQNINVETRNQEVTLRGTVGSPAERAAAINIVAATPNVRKLVNELEVQPTPRGDSEILRDALRIGPALGNVNGSTMAIGVVRQVVTIQGTFPTLAALDRVVSGLMAVEGVKDVQIKASIEPPSPVADTHLMTAVAQSLMTDGTVDASQIRVGVRNGIVVLEGETPSLFQIMRAETITRNLTGVRAVENRLALPQQAAKATPVG